MKHSLFFFAAAFALSANAQPKKPFTITGKIEDIKTGLIYLNVYENGVET